jgi:thiamine biosynthesis lipoprotein
MNGSGGTAWRRTRALYAASGLAVLLVLGLAACGPRTARETLLTGETMGSRWTLKIVGELPRSAEALQREIQQRFEVVDAALSTWRPDSALSRFNAHPDDGWQALDPELARVMGYALSLAAETDGAYDVTIGPVVDLWGFGPAGRRIEAPAAATLQEAMARTGWQRVEMDAAGARTRKPPEVSVDLSSLGKGRGVDRVSAYLLSQGLSDHLIDLSGKLRAHGRNARGEPWQVAVETPGPDDASGEPRVATGPVALRDEAIATAGTYRRYFLDDGRHYSHLIDTRTGHPIAFDTVSATVLAADALQADALCTVLMLLPPEEALAFAERRGVAALLLRERNGNLEQLATSQWLERELRNAQPKEGA